MITPQDIREKTFEKAVFGGYDMATVDNFLEEIANDLALLQKENAVLKGKMKVLVDKVEEYRGNEDALRMAVLSAQRLGNMIEKEAKDKSDTMLSSAMNEAARVTQEAALEVQMEKGRLEEAKRASAQFIENMNLLCRRQMAFLDKLSQMDFVKEAAAAPAPAAPAPAPEEPAEMHETVKSIEETVAKVSEEPVDDVRSDIAKAAAEAEEMATRAFGFVSDPEDNLESTNQFSFDLN
ncbi:MAG: DivIVA domain-containing protein [Oscillospiraceae bacterium]